MFFLQTAGPVGVWGGEASAYLGLEITSFSFLSDFYLSN